MNRILCTTCHLLLHPVAALAVGACMAAGAAAATETGVGDGEGVGVLARLEALERAGQADPAAAQREILAMIQGLPAGSPEWVRAEVDAGVMANKRGDKTASDAAAQALLRQDSREARAGGLLIGGAWFNGHGEAARADDQFIEARALMAADAPVYLRAMLLRGEGEAARREGRYEDAALRYQEHLRLVEQSDQPWRRVDGLNSLAGMLLDAGQPERARQVTREAIALGTELGYEYGIADAWIDEGIRLSDAGDPAATLAAWQSAIAHAQRARAPAQVILATADLADYYLSRGDYQIAYDQSLAALGVARALADEAAVSVAVGNMGLSLIGLHHKDEGLSLVEQSMAIDAVRGSAVDQANNEHELASYLEKSGYLGDALMHYRRFQALADALSPKEQQRRLIQLDEQFSNERRRHQLELLERERALKGVELRAAQLRTELWAAAVVAGVLLLGATGWGAWRLHRTNQRLADVTRRLRVESEHDALTGLHNRRHFQQAIAGDTPGPGRGTIALIDVDHFKRINDTCGHALGDEVLRRVAVRLRDAACPGETVLRWGGEEFMLFAPVADTESPEARAGRLMAAVTGTPIEVDGRSLEVTVSIGIADFPVPDGEGGTHSPSSWRQALRLADAALYRAKHGGRNKACIVTAADWADGAVRPGEEGQHPLVPTALRLSPGPTPHLAARAFGA